MMKALIVVDVQYDFCPGGKLAVPFGDEVIRPINRVLPFFMRNKFKVVFTRDYHPQETKHFDDWPEHCVIDTHGAEIHQLLDFWIIGGASNVEVLSKGMDPNIDAYSPYQGEINSSGLTLADYLSKSHVSELVVCGLATDYCVKATVLDSLELGYEVTVISDGIAAVDINSGDGQKAIDEMSLKGAIFMSSMQFLEANFEQPVG